MNTKQNYFLSQPHQPFFILGVTNAIIMMLLFALAYKGVLAMQIDSTFFHVYSLVFLLFSNVFTGFLFTTFPRFNQTNVIEKSYYTRIFYANSLGSALFAMGALFNSHALLFAMLLLFVAQIFIVIKLQKIFLTGRAPDKTDSFWILTAQYFGLAAHLLFIIIIAFDLPALVPTAINIAFYLYLIFLAFSVGQRMIFIKIIFALFILKSISASASFQIGEIIVDIILASFMLKEFLHWDLHPMRSPSILWVLHLSLFWLPAAFALSAVTLTAELVFETSFYFLNIHLLAIGFLTQACRHKQISLQQAFSSLFSSLYFCVHSLASMSLLNGVQISFSIYPLQHGLYSFYSGEAAMGKFLSFLPLVSVRE